MIYFFDGEGAVPSDEPVTAPAEGEGEGAAPGGDTPEMPAEEETPAA